ncbi:Ubiquitin-protein_ligase [Hexamita inflata]|uniref:HECT-type E3 ubiquitin transferase n=1 Tax=Hexamita inflata TaxID=28002 RepID=A0ABP1JV65_9EUKA
MEQQLLQVQLTHGCNNSQCQNEYCQSSKFFNKSNITAEQIDQVVNSIYYKLGNMSLCLPSTGQMLCRWLNASSSSQLESWPTQVKQVDCEQVEGEIASKHQHIIQSTDFGLLSSVISCNMSSLQQLEYFLNSQDSIINSIRVNTLFFQTLLELEQEDPSLQKEDVIIEMNGPITHFIQKLLEVLFNNTYVLAQDPSCMPSSAILVLLLSLPEQFLERSNLPIVCTATLFNSLSKDKRLDFQRYFIDFLQSNPLQQQFLEQCVCCCNQYVSVTLSLYDKPRKPVSVIDLIPVKREFLAVIELMNFLHLVMNRVEQTEFIVKLKKELQNEYVNSNSYNITPDTDYWLQKNPCQLKLDLLPLPLQMMIRARQRQRVFPDQMFTLLEYPFILNSGTKAQIFRYECTHNIPHIGKLEVSRQNIVNDTLAYIVSRAEDWSSQDARALLRIPLKIQFQNEEGIDAGGLSNEFFTLICEQLFGQKYHLFKYMENERVFWFEKFPMLDESDLQLYYTFVGVVFGLAMLNDVHVENNFPSFFYKKLLGDPVHFEELAQLDLQLYQSLKQLQTYDGDFEDLCLSFSVTEEVFGTKTQVDLIDHGSEIAVTNFNKDEFVNLRFAYEIHKAVEQQFTAFKKGFNLVTQCSSFSLFSHSELELVLCGEPILDFQALKKNAKYQDPYKENHKTIVWFWKILEEELNDQQRIEFMKFVFGSARAPAGGLSRQRFEIHKNGEDDSRLPTSHTCFGILMLPEYSCYNVLKEKLTQAIQHYEGFGLQ